MKSNVCGIILLLLALITYLARALTPTVCVAPYPCAREESTSVTCYFHTDMNSTRHGIAVKHYPLGSSKTELGRNALLCYWMEGAEKHTCIAYDGYQFNGNITDRLTLEVPHVSKETEGLYACHILPPDDTVVHTCELSLRERPEHPSSTVTPSTTQDSDDNESNTTTDDSVKCKVTAIVVGLVLIILFGLVKLRSLKLTLSKEHAGSFFNSLPGVRWS